MRLAVFADGTWNKMDFTEKETNVAKLCRASVNDRSRGQVRFYDAGVGTKWYDRFRGGAFGVGISQNIKDCYDFIVREWSGHDDEIFLFGFSRGAYTVRSMAGLLNFVGIVRDPGDPNRRAHLVDTAYAFYRDARVIYPQTDDERRKADPRRRADYEDFCRRHVRDGDRRARIKMLGVWDTVGALGIPLNWMNELLNPFPHKFHNTALGPNVEHAYHAVSIDEKRRAFQPTLWDDDPRVHQVYFVGVHSDVGGGYEDDTKLANIALSWMAHHAASHGLDVEWNKLPKRDKKDHCGRQHESWTSFWRLVRRHDRDIQFGTRLHASVQLRLAEQHPLFSPHPYKPAKLLPPLDRYRFDADPFHSPSA